MNKYIQKFVSLVLIIAISLLVLNELKIIVFTTQIKEILSFVTIVLMVFSSTTVICSNNSGIHKFINYLILLSVITGVIFMIIQKKLNVIIYASLILSVIYALLDMIYSKKS